MFVIPLDSLAAPITAEVRGWGAGSSEKVDGPVFATDFAKDFAKVFAIVVNTLSYARLEQSSLAGYKSWAILLPYIGKIYRTVHAHSALQVCGTTRRSPMVMAAWQHGILTAWQSGSRRAD